MLASASVNLWDRDTVYRLVLGWVEKEGRGFRDLRASQVANFARAAEGIDDADEMLPRLEQWLEDAARRGDERGPWRRRGETGPLASEIPILFQRALEETLGNANLAANQNFYSIWHGKEPEDVARGRRLAVLREVTAALVKCYRTGKEGRHGN